MQKRAAVSGVLERTLDKLTELTDHVSEQEMAAVSERAGEYALNLGVVIALCWVLDYTEILDQLFAQCQATRLAAGFQKFRGGVPG